MYVSQKLLVADDEVLGPADPYSLPPSSSSDSDLGSNFGADVGNGGGDVAVEAAASGGGFMD
jgi:hypothetical protein